jgi:hypothetical protein
VAIGQAASGGSLAGSASISGGVAGCASLQHCFNSRPRDHGAPAVGRSAGGGYRGAANKSRRAAERNRGASWGQPVKRAPDRRRRAPAEGWPGDATDRAYGARAAPFTLGAYCKLAPVRARRQARQGGSEGAWPPHASPEYLIKDIISRRMISTVQAGEPMTVTEMELGAGARSRSPPSGHFPADEIPVPANF